MICQERIHYVVRMQIFIWKMKHQNAGCTPFVRGPFDWWSHSVLRGEYVAPQCTGPEAAGNDATAQHLECHNGSSCILRVWVSCNNTALRCLRVITAQLHFECRLSWTENRHISHRHYQPQLSFSFLLKTVLIIHHIKPKQQGVTSTECTFCNFCLKQWVNNPNIFPVSHCTRQECLMRFRLFLGCWCHFQQFPLRRRQLNVWLSRCSNPLLWQSADKLIRARLNAFMYGQARPHRLQFKVVYF